MMLGAALVRCLMVGCRSAWGVNTAWCGGHPVCSRFDRVRFCDQCRMLIAARVVLGIAVGIASYTALCIFLKWQVKTFAVRWSVCTVDGHTRHRAGVFIRYSVQLSGNWRAMLGVLALPAVLLIIWLSSCQIARAGWRKKGVILSGRSVAYAARYVGKSARRTQEIRESLKLKQGGWALFKINRTSVVLCFSVCCCRRCSSLPDEHHHVLRAAYLQNGGLYDHEQQMIATLVVGLTFMFATFMRFLR